MTTKEGAGADHPQLFRATFIGTLVEDIIGAKRLVAANHTQSNCRHLIRSLFAAIEGMVWKYREHIVDIARSCDSLTLEEEIAFSEISYSVTPQGKIVETARFVPLLAMFRLTTKLAQRTNTDFEPSFEGAGWETLRQAVEIRNRITHPKSLNDLQIGDLDLKKCEEGFDWLFEVCLTAMELVNDAFATNTDTMRKFLEDLKLGDPKALAEYRAAQNSADLE